METFQPSGSDVMGLWGVRIPARTKRRLSENPNGPTVFVAAFLLFVIVFHVRQEKSNVFVTKK